MSEPSHSEADQSACDDGVAPDEGQSDVCVLENTQTSLNPGLKNQMDSNEAIRAETDSSSYCVTWTVYIALAVPQDKGIDKPRGQLPQTFEKTKEKKKDSSTSVLKSLSCYHIEYKLFPGDTETTRVDLFFYGPVAKLCHQDESKVLRTWCEGDQVWLGWSQSFKIPVNRDSLITLASQRIRLQIWNSEDKRSPQAHHENRKGFSLLGDDTSDVNGCVKTMVNKIRAFIEKESKTSTKLMFQSKSESGSETERNTFRQELGLNVRDLEGIRKTGPLSVEINPIPLLAGDTVNEHFPLSSAGITEVLISISLDKPLMSEQLEAELNPLIITILSATSLPSSPVPFHVLQEECLPVYCQYKLHNLKPHRTNYHKQSTNIYFRDVNVIMTGLMSSVEVQELLSGPSLEIQVHDRDRKLDKEPKEPTTFEKIGTHGVARLDLSELLLGKKSLRSNLPIKRCCPLARKESAEQKRRAAVGCRAPLPQGHYVENNSQLKVKVDIAHPFSIKTADGEMEPRSGPFGRIVYIFSSDNSSMVTKLRSEILQINAAAFHLDSCSLGNIAAAISNHFTNFRHDGNKNVDFVSGFHVLDEMTHICVIEGLRDRAVKRLWEVCPMKFSENMEEQVIVHYNSGLGFFKRLYDSLDLCLSPIQLRESLASIMKPGNYVRASACFQALSRLGRLCEGRLLDQMVQHDLFPSADMIRSMSKEFGVCAQSCGQSVVADTTGDTAGDTSIKPVRVKRLIPLDTTNTEYIRQRPSQLRNFIQENVKNVREQSERLPKRDPGSFLQVDGPADQPVHNYSIQTFNFSRRAKELLQKHMAKMPGRRFTYCQQYHSATVEPGPEPNYSSTPTSAAWVSSINKTAAHPQLAGVEEPRKPWRANNTIADVLKPTMSRDTWPWELRNQDFQLYFQASLFFGTPPPFHPAGKPRTLHHPTPRWLIEMTPPQSVT